MAAGDAELASVDEEHSGTTGSQRCCSSSFSHSAGPLAAANCSRDKPGLGKAKFDLLIS